MDENVNVTARDAAFDLPRLRRCFFERSSQPMVAVEGTTYIVRHANAAFLRLAEMTRGELIDRPFAHAIPEGTGNDCVAVFDRVFRTQKPENLAEQRHGRTPTIYWSYAIWPILGTDERPVGLMIQVTEATEAAVFREQAAAVNESLLLSSLRQHELTEKAETMSAGLDAALRAKDHFLAVLSHELRTPLTPVLATVAMLLRDERFDADTREQLEVIRRNAEMEAMLIDDLLDVTRIARGKVELRKRPTELREIIQRAVEVCLPDLDARKLEFAVHARDGPYIVDADVSRMQQVFWNLLKNSIKFTPVGGCVGIRCRRDGDGHVVVEVSDSGVGIEPEALPRLFDAFEQGGVGTTRQFGGLGLGLTISRAMVTMHGGTISAHSAGKDKGATFSVRLPLMGAGAVPSHVAPRGEQETRQPVRSRRILLVEDHGDTARIMRRLLEADGHQVEAAADMATALKLIGEQTFDLLLSDLGLPDGSGLDLMRALRSAGSTLPGIALSGYGQEEDLAQSRSAGFAAHLTKPVSLPELESAIASVVGNATPR
jgi:signal transduction histidine kinase/ActR/RegA family two-component response regulator